MSCIGCSNPTQLYRGKHILKQLMAGGTLLVGCLLMSATTYAQLDYFDENRTFHGGLVGGLNISQVDGDNFAGYTKKGFNLGGIVYFKMDEEHIKGSLEVSYTQKGAQSKGVFVAAPGLAVTDYAVTLNYAEVPFMINYFDQHLHHFGAGFSYSRLGTKKETITFSPSQPIANLDDYPFKKSDFNFLLGANFHCWKGFFFNMRFQYSLISVRNKVPQDYGRNQQFNNMWTFRVMYLFK